MKIIPISLKNIKAKYFDAIVKPTEYYTPGIVQKVLYCICPTDNTEGIVAQTNSGILHNYEVIDTFPPSDKACIACGGGFYHDLEGNIIFLANEDYYIVYVSNGFLNIKAKVGGVTLTQSDIVNNVTSVSVVYGWQTIDPSTSDTDLGLCIAYSTPSGTFMLRLNQYTLEGVQTIQLNTKGLVTSVDISLTDDYRISVVATYPGGAVMHLSDRYWVGGAVQPETIMGRYSYGDRTVSQVKTQFIKQSIGTDTIKGKFGNKNASAVNNTVIRQLYAYNTDNNIVIYFDGAFDTSSVDITGFTVVDADGTVFAPSIHEIPNEHTLILNCEGMNNFIDSVTVTYNGTGLVTPVGTSNNIECSYTFVPVGLIPDDFPPPQCLGSYIVPGGNNGYEYYLLFDRRIRNKSFSAEDFSSIVASWSEHKYTIGQSDVVGPNGEQVAVSTIANNIEILNITDLPDEHTLPIEDCIDTHHTVLKVTTAASFRNGTNSTDMHISYDGSLGHLIGTKPVESFVVATPLTGLVPYPRIYTQETVIDGIRIAKTCTTTNTQYKDITNNDNPVIQGRYGSITVSVENTGQIVP